jgi:hypothetical protein
METVMSNLIQGIRNLFSNVSAGNNYELHSLKSENPAAKVLTAEAPRAQYYGSPKIAGRSLFNTIYRAINTIDVEARASTIGRAMAKGVETFKSFISLVQAGKGDSVSVMRAFDSSASSTSIEAVALGKIFKAMGQKNPTATIKALKNLKELPGTDGQRLNILVQARLREIGKNQINAFNMVDQFLTSDPWKAKPQSHDSADNEVRQFYADLCKSFEINWTAMPR